MKALQRRLEESKQSSREKDHSMNKLRGRLRQLEEAVQNACKEVDEKEARMKKEHKMLQDVRFLFVSALSLHHQHLNAKPVHSVYF